MIGTQNAIGFVASVFVVDKDRVLLVFNKKLGQFFPLGGPLELENDPEGALSRNIEEQVGIKIEIIGEKDAMINRRGEKILFSPICLRIPKIKGTHHIEMVYFAHIKSGSPHLIDDKNKVMLWLTTEYLQASSNMIAGDTHLLAHEAIRCVSKVQQGKRVTMNPILRG